jgi:hypothetical protein
MKKKNIQVKISKFDVEKIILPANLVKKSVHLLLFFLLFSFPVFAQNNARTWINSIDLACRVVENKNFTQYLINEYNDHYIVYDVYGADVRVNKDGSALITGRSSLSSLNVIYNRFFEELLITFGRPSGGGSASTSNGGRATAIFNAGSVQYELALNAFESTMTLTRIPLTNRINDFIYEKNNNGIIIIGYIGRPVNVVIPDKIEDIPVIEIGKNAFAKNL